MAMLSLHRCFGLLVLAALLSACSDQAPASGGSASEAAARDDKLAEEVLQSATQMDAREWVQKYPKSVINSEEKRLAPQVEKLYAAGATRVVIGYVKAAKGEWLQSMVVVLPSDAAARQKVFAVEQSLSPLVGQTPATDRGQKYLYYTFD